MNLSPGDGSIVLLYTTTEQLESGDRVERETWVFRFFPTFAGEWKLLNRVLAMADNPDLTFSHDDVHRLGEILHQYHQDMGASW